KHRVICLEANLIQVCIPSMSVVEPWEEVLLTRGRFRIQTAFYHHVTAKLSVIKINFIWSISARTEHSSTVLQNPWARGCESCLPTVIPLRSGITNFPSA